MLSSLEATGHQECTVCAEATLREIGAVFSAGGAEVLVLINGAQRPVGVMTKRDFIELCVKGALDVPIAEPMPDHSWVSIHSERTLGQLVMVSAEYLIFVDDQGFYVEIITKREIANRYILELDSPLVLSGYGCMLAIINAEGENVFFDPGLDTSREEAVLAFAEPSILRKTLLETAHGVRPQEGVEMEWGGRPWVVFTVPVREGKNVCGAIGIFHQAQKVRPIAKRLEHVQQLYDEVNTILETSYDGFTIVNGQGVITRVNKAHERITGSCPENMIGRHVLDAEKNGEFINPVSMMVLRQKRRMTISQMVRNGKYVTVTGNPVFDAEGNVKMVVCNVRDTSEIEAMQEKLLQTKRVNQVELEHLRKQQLDFDQIIVVSPLMRRVMETVEHIADKDTSVLILGETGVGKEVLVKKIHQLSLRKDGPYLKINCCAIPASLLESELFGYENGAFTGAKKGGKPGLLEAAHGGTLFLDEIGDVSMELQVKLLRALQEKEIVRVGGLKGIDVDIRFIFATNRDLKAMVAGGRFREDLYYRLNVVPISIPPLRDRREDILPLLEHFLAKFNQKHGYDKQFSPALVKALCNYSWPGNVRELQNLVERLVVSVYSKVIDTIHFTEPIVASQMPEQEALLDPASASISQLQLRTAVETLEKKLITQALLEKGSMGRAASALGVDRTTILRKIGKYGILYKYQW
jgi:PAS domain S-box-containing protein